MQATTHTSGTQLKPAHHVIPLKIYAAVGISLLFMTAVTVWISLFDFGNWNMIIAMSVATIKAGLVAAYFMQLRYENKFFLAMLLVALIALTTFIVFTMIDNKSRAAIYDYEMKEIRKNSKMYDKKTPAAVVPAPATSTPTPSTPEPAKK
jgi:cytochrome c oxidase subunit IV